MWWLTLGSRLVHHLHPPATSYMPCSWVITETSFSALGTSMRRMLRTSPTIVTGETMAINPKLRLDGEWRWRFGQIVAPVRTCCRFAGPQDAFTTSLRTSYLKWKVSASILLKISPAFRRHTGLSGLHVQLFVFSVHCGGGCTKVGCFPETETNVWSMFDFLFFLVGHANLCCLFWKLHIEYWRCTSMNLQLSEWKGIFHLDTFLLRRFLLFCAAPQAYQTTFASWFECWHLVPSLSKKLQEVVHKTLLQTIITVLIWEVGNQLIVQDGPASTFDVV